MHNVGTLSGKQLNRLNLQTYSTTRPIDYINWDSFVLLTMKSCWYFHSWFLPVIEIWRAKSRVIYSHLHTLHILKLTANKQKMTVGYCCLKDSLGASQVPVFVVGIMCRGDWQQNVSLKYVYCPCLATVFDIGSFSVMEI